MSENDMSGEQGWSNPKIWNIYQNGNFLTQIMTNMIDDPEEVREKAIVAGGFPEDITVEEYIDVPIERNDQLG